MPVENLRLPILPMEKKITIKLSKKSVWIQDKF